MAGFGMDPERKDLVYEEYIGEYVIISPPMGSRTYAGKLDSIEEGYFTLNPHQSGDWHPGKGLTRRMVDKNLKVPVIGCVIEPTTEENLEAYCTYLNKKDREANGNKGLMEQDSHKTK